MGVSEYFWTELLNTIKEQEVIPIIGQELLTVELDGKTVPLYRYLAERFAESLEVPRTLLPENFTLNHIVYQYLQMPGRKRERIDLYRRMKAVMEERALPVPALLKKLAGVRDFKLFVTTTFDTLLEEAINEVRFAGKSRTESRVHTLKEVGDLPKETRNLEGPLVYYLFGRVSSQPNYAITDEDTLEFIHSLQTERGRPHLLFDEFKERPLLLLGNNYSNWLARFFIRTVRNQRLIKCDQEAVVASDTVCNDASLVLFLSSPLCSGTRIFESGGVQYFVDELYTRWSKANPSTSVDFDTPAPGSGAISRESDSCAVFLSYASQDLEMVTKVKESLDRAGLDVWFDKRGGLEAGDDYDLKIHRGISKCAVFCPFISRNTEKRREGYFRREWRYAAERAKDMDDSSPFILPIVIDNTAEEEALVPQKFIKTHWTRLADGKLPYGFIERVVKLVQEYRKRECCPS